MDIGDIVSIEALKQLYLGSMRVQQFAFIVFVFMLIAIIVGVIIQSV